MLEALKSFFAKHAGPGGAETAAADGTQRLHVAACALLLEMAYADDEFSAAERAHIEDALRRHFDLGEEAARDLIVLGEEARREAVDLHTFTTVISQHYDEGQRLVLAELLWRVVYADGRLSSHEDQLARKLAVLLDLRPGYLAVARRRALGEADGG